MNDSIFTNTSDKPIFIGSRMIPPGETHMVPTHLLPSVNNTPVDVEDGKDETPVFSVDVFLKQSAQEIEVGIESFDITVLDEMFATENAAPEPRQNVIDVINSARLISSIDTKKPDFSVGNVLAQNLREIDEQLNGLSNDQLNQLLDAEKTGKNRSGAIEAITEALEN